MVGALGLSGGIGRWGLWILSFGAERGGGGGNVADACVQGLYIICKAWCDERPL